MDNMNNIYVWVYLNNLWKIAKCDNENLFLENSEIIKLNENHKIFPKNEDTNSDIANLIDLVHLNEPSILYSSFLRYNNNKIYTFTGKILLAINPFKKIDIYNEKYIDQYNSLKLNTPHPYLISQQCLDNVINTNKNQVVLVSGESGAGKTVTTKFLMKYISSVSKKNVNNLEKKILASNPILEAFGNAKTLRNDNSSRFGKFIKLQFKDNILVGARIETYLLEKIRLTSLSKGERNFHIFYMLLKCYFNYNSKIFNYIHKSNVFERNDNVTDKETFNELNDSFNELGFTKKEVSNIFNFVLFILLLGNLNKVEELLELEDFSKESELNFDIKLLNDYLDVNIIKTGLDEIRSKRTKKEFINSRDTVAQNLYLLLFNYIVKRINMTIESDYNSYIGILDIFGFEVFKKNGFEQLCINYTNERLQNIFNKYIFELEQEEYKRENIDWEDINFESNKKIIELIDNKKNSIFSYQIEQSILGSGNDNFFYQSLKNNLIENNYFNIQNKHIVKKKFMIKHYAGEVIYNSNNYIEKNRNTLDKRFNKFIKSGGDIIKGFDTSIFSFVTKKIKNKNIIVQFKNQLDNLLNEISKQNQFYIRCIKPNDQNIPNNFDKKRVLEQFKYCGVLEAIKIARLGYPVRIKNNIFQDTYFSLFNYYKINLNENNISLLFIKRKYQETKYKIGLTKVFLKKDLHNILNEEQNKIKNISSIKVQSIIRMNFISKKINIFKKFIIFIQFYFKTLYKKKIKSINKINTFYRSKKELIKFKKIKKYSILIQSTYRIYEQNKEFRKILSTVKVQRYYRLYKFRTLNNKLSKLFEIIYLDRLRFKFNELKEKLIKKNACNIIIKNYKKCKRSRELKNRINILQEQNNLKGKNKDLQLYVDKLEQENISLMLKKDKLEIELKKMEQNNKREIKDISVQTNTNIEDKLVQISILNKETNIKNVTDMKDNSVQCKLFDDVLLKVEKNISKNLTEQIKYLNSKNNIQKIDLSNKNKIILNLSSKLSELSKKNGELTNRVNLFQQDQEILGIKLKNLYLKIDYYEEILRKYKINQFI